jgi:hypothetical protein
MTVAVGTTNPVVLPGGGGARFHSSTDSAQHLAGLLDTTVVVPCAGYSAVSRMHQATRLTVERVVLGDIASETVDTASITTVFVRQGRVFFEEAEVAYWLRTGTRAVEARMVRLSIRPGGRQG